jgi:hypothetical protein
MTCIGDGGALSVLRYRGSRPHGRWGWRAGAPSIDSYPAQSRARFTLLGIFGPRPFGSTGYLQPGCVKYRSLVLDGGAYIDKYRA